MAGELELGARLILDALDDNAHCRGGLLLRNRVCVSGEVQGAECLIALLSSPVSPADLWWYAYSGRTTDGMWMAVVFFASRLVDAPSMEMLAREFAFACTDRQSRSDLHEVHRERCPDPAAAAARIAAWIKRFQRRPAGALSAVGNVADLPPELAMLRRGRMRRAH